MGLSSRRELLQMFLGAPLALAACRARPRVPPLPDGELVGASDGFGHRLRDQAPPPRPLDWQRAAVVIVGGGVAGLAAAWRLARAGMKDFILLELEGAPGGTARSGRSNITAYPWGAHYIPAPAAENRALVALLDEMCLLEGHDREGEPVIAEQFLCRDPEERVFYRGRWYEGLYLRAGATPADLAQRDRLRAEVDRWAGWRDRRGRRAFALPVGASSDDAEVTALDRLSMDEWLRARGFDSQRLRWLVEYGCRDDYGATLEDTSAWAGLFYFASRQPRPGAESRPLLTWPEGNGRLVAHLYGRVEKNVRLDVAAADLVPHADGVEVTALRRGGGTLGIRAERVIFAAPQFVARHVIRPWRDAPPPHIGELQYGAWMVANLHLRDRPAVHGFPLAWDNVLYDSPSLGYVVATHQRGLDRGPTVFTYYYPLPGPAGRARLASAGRAEWAEVALADLERAHPDIRSLTTRLDVMRWGHAMIRPRPGFIWGGARTAAARPFRGIHFAHTELSGVALFEEAFDHGVRAAEEVLRERGARFESLRA